MRISHKSKVSWRELRKVIKINQKQENKRNKSSNHDFLPFNKTEINNKIEDTINNVSGNVIKMPFYQERTQGLAT